MNQISVKIPVPLYRRLQKIRDKSGRSVAFQIRTYVDTGATLEETSKRK